jgi:hypothetical protein
MIWKTFGDHANQGLGWNVTSVGDLTGDGIPDILVGQPFDFMNSNGMVRVLSGADGSTVYSILGANSGDELSGGADLGDVDGDGIPDFVIGAEGFDNAATDQGVVTLCSGKAGSPIYAIYGSASDFLGRGVVALGDLDGDGVSDFVASSGGDYALVVSGAAGSVL